MGPDIAAACPALCDGVLIQDHPQLEQESQRDMIQLGIVVDSVSEVLNIKAEEIEETPSFSGNVKIDYILGMAKMKGGVKILLDIGKVLSRDRMLQELRGIDCEAFNRSVDITISRLRQKLNDDPKAPVFIRTIWGAGYVFVGGDPSA